jgi:hypothetical protein
MHTPTPDSNPVPDDQDDGVRQPPVPPDREDEIVPIEEPPKPGRGSDAPPMIASCEAPLVVHWNVLGAGSILHARPRIA